MASIQPQPDRTNDDGLSDVDMDDISSSGDSSSDESSDDPNYPLIKSAPLGKPKTQLSPTPFAPVYRSTFFLQKENQHLLKRLRHLNCSYLSTPGLAPSLTQLKAHAQSLAIVIKSLSVSTLPSVIDSRNVGVGPAAFDGETWDWLSDLTKPYTGPKNPALTYHHSLPLTALMNTLEQIPSKLDQTGTIIRDRCPLHSAAPDDLQLHGSSLPYATHQALIAHANHLLELIDHEYSAKGGLLSILPPESEKADREKAESTILGQFILYIQRLVSRMHELERECANALDVLKGESNVPHQALSRLGPEGRQGRELVYPQDRFVLVNAGQDVWDFLDREFNEKERVDEIVKANYLKNGVMGEALWEENGGKEFLRGITAIDVTTRYFRLRRDPLKTVFIIPAHQRHPGTTATVEMERQPTIVSVVKPVWPERRSLWEQKNRDNLQLLKTTQDENRRLKSEQDWTREEKKLLLHENELSDGKIRALERKVAELEGLLNGSGVTTLQARLHDDQSKMDQAKKDVQASIARAQLHESTALATRRKAQEGLKDLFKQRADWNKTKADAEQRMALDHGKFVAHADDVDREQAVGATELERKLKEVLGGQVKEMQIIMEWLRERKVAFEKDVVAEETVKRGLAAGEKLVATAARKAAIETKTKAETKVSATPAPAPISKFGRQSVGGDPPSDLFKSMTKGLFGKRAAPAPDVTTGLWGGGDIIFAERDEVKNPSPEVKKDAFTFPTPPREEWKKAQKTGGKVAQPLFNTQIRSINIEDFPDTCSGDEGELPTVDTSI